MEKDLDKLSHDAFYLNPEMVKFLLIENLALKLSLHEMGILKPEEFATRKKEAAKILEKQVQEKITEWKNSHPIITDLFKSDEENINQQADSVQSTIPPVVS